MRRAISRRHGGQALLMYLVVLFGFGLRISEVAAHSRLLRSDPSARAVLETAPKELKLWFNELVEPACGSCRRKDHMFRWPAVATVPIRIFLSSRFRMIWRLGLIGYHILSVDGHVVDSQLTFTIKKKKPA